MSTVLGIDLGGTKIAAARFHCESWRNEADLKVETEAAKGFEHVVELMEHVITELRKEDTQAVGIGVPGLVQHPSGVILKMPNIPGAERVALQDLLRSRAHLPVLVDNDANCFTLAEAVEGAGKGYPVVVGVTLGTGVGGGIVINGTIYRGNAGYAAEFGHMLLKPGEPPYETTDKRGDAEQFLSGTAMGKRCAAANSPEEYLQGGTCAFMHPDIFKEVAWMCTNLIHVLDPSVIVFGGSAGYALKPHLDDIHTELDTWLLPDTPHPELKIAELADGAMRGAALLCRKIA